MYEIVVVYRVGFVFSFYFYSNLVRYIVDGWFRWISIYVYVFNFLVFIFLCDLIFNW